MSKYIDSLVEQLTGKDVKALTEEIKASNNISKILKDQKEKEQRKKAEKDIQNMMRRY